MLEVMRGVDSFRSDDFRFFNFLLNRKITASGKEKVPWMLYGFGALTAEQRRDAIPALIKPRYYLFAHTFMFDVRHA